MSEYNDQYGGLFPSSEDGDNCYQPTSASMPKIIENSPGLSTITYRIGVYDDFKTSLLEKISQKTMLRKLTTRSDDDQSISLLDAWAVVADVLTFYQERIANEGYLRTAIDSRSIMELARSIGYESKPGVSASTYVQFNIENSPDSVGKEITIGGGTKLQSLPAQGETPQIFETAETIKARSEWNQINTNSTEPQIIADNTSIFYFKGTDTKLKPNDRIMITTEQDNINNNKKSGVENKEDNIYLLGKRQLKFAIRLIDKVQLDTKLARTVVTVFTPSVKSTSIEKQVPVLTNDTLNDTIADISGKLGKPIPRQSLNLDINTLNQTDLTAIALKHGWEIDDLFKMLNDEFKQKQRDLTSKTKVYAFRIRSNLFGYNASKSDLIPRTTRSHLYPKRDWDLRGGFNVCNYYCDLHDRPAHDSIKEKRKDDDRPAHDSIKEKHNDDDRNIKIYLDNSHPSILPKSWIILEDDSKFKEKIGNLGQERRPLFIYFASDVTLTDFFGTGSKVTSLAVNLNDVEFECKDFKLRNTVVYAQSEELSLADDRPASNTNSVIKNNSICLDRLANGLNRGKYLSIDGVLADKSGGKKTQIAKISDINFASNRSFNLFTEITFEKDIMPNNGYKVDTVTMNANVSYITHGESTIDEVIGSGDPSRRQQEFVLKQSPVAYTPLTTGNGVISTLEIRINGILWKEVPSLYYLKPTDQAYITRKDVNNKIHVIFGDDSKGARPPAGMENIVARYRVGGGNAGNVKENQINIIVSKPLGVKSASNPTLVQAATDPEDPESVRKNTPNRINTLQRISSLKDFENFVLSFQGIGKVKGVQISNGEYDIVSLTIASDKGLPIDQESELYNNLCISISEIKDPTIEFRLNSFSQKFFILELRIKVASGITDIQGIVSQITDVLQNKFSFESRQFGQPVTREEIVVAIQHVQGIVVVDEVSLYTQGDKNNKALTNKIYSHSAHWDNVTNQISEAELLVIQKDSIKIDIEEMK